METSAELPARPVGPAESGLERGLARPGARGGLSTCLPRQQLPLLPTPGNTDFPSSQKLSQGQGQLWAGGRARSGRPGCRTVPRPSPRPVSPSCNGGSQPCIPALEPGPPALMSWALDVCTHVPRSALFRCGSAAPLGPPGLCEGRIHVWHISPVSSPPHLTEGQELGDTQCHARLPGSRACALSPDAECRPSHGRGGSGHHY